MIQAYSTTTKNVIKNIHIRLKLLEIYKYFTFTQRWRIIYGTSRYVTMPSVYVAGFIILTMVTGFVAIKAIPSGFAT